MDQYAIAVLFGSFRTEEFFLPAPKKIAKQHNLAARPVFRAYGEEAEQRSETAEKMKHFPDGGSIAPALERIFRDSGGANHWHPIGDPDNEFLAAELKIKFFEYFLRRFLNVRFALRAFTPDREEGRPYDEFMKSFGIFAHDDIPKRSGAWRPCTRLGEVDFLDGSELLQGVSPAPEGVYVEYDMWIWY